MVKTLIDLRADRSQLSGFGDISTDTNLKAAMIEYVKQQDSSHEYFPKSCRDIFESFSILDRAFQCQLSGKRVRGILDTAEYWLRTSVVRKERKVFNQHNCGEEYLRSPPITGRVDRPVRRIVFILISRDQGWSDAVQYHSTYDASYSYWDACKILAGSGERHPRTSRIQHNLHAYPHFRTHVQVWGVVAGSPDDDRWTAAGTRWIDELKRGDCVAVRPRAEFPGWVNEVAGARIEVQTSVLLR